MPQTRQRGCGPALSAQTVGLCRAMCFISASARAGGACGRVVKRVLDMLRRINITLRSGRIGGLATALVYWRPAPGQRLRVRRLRLERDGRRLERLERACEVAAVYGMSRSVRALYAERDALRRIVDRDAHEYDRITELYAQQDSPPEGGCPSVHNISPAPEVKGALGGNDREKRL